MGIHTGAHFLVSNKEFYPFQIMSTGNFFLKFKIKLTFKYLNVIGNLKPWGFLKIIDLVIQVDKSVPQELNNGLAISAVPSFHSNHDTYFTCSPALSPQDETWWYTYSLSWNGYSLAIHNHWKYRQ